MKGLSLRQPWAWAVTHLPPPIAKRIENRAWPWLDKGFVNGASSGIKQGELIAVHASKTAPKDFDWAGVCEAMGRPFSQTEIDQVHAQRGHITGTARVVDILRTDAACTVTEGTADKPFPHHVIRPDDYARFVRKSAVLPKQDDPEYLAQLDQLKRWWMGPYAFHLADVTRFAAPIAASGALNFWEVPAEMAERVEYQRSLAIASAHDQVVKMIEVDPKTPPGTVEIHSGTSTGRITNIGTAQTQTTMFDVPVVKKPGGLH